MDRDGVDVQLMHPNRSLFALYSDDHELSIAHARVYNDYVVERYTPYFDRIAPTAPVPLTDVGDAVAEIERVAARGVPGDPAAGDVAGAVLVATSSSRCGPRRSAERRARVLPLRDRRRQGRRGGVADAAPGARDGRRAEPADGRRLASKRMMAPVRLQHHQPAADHHRADRRRRAPSATRSCTSASSSSTRTGSRRSWARWTRRGSPASARTPTGGSATGTRSRPADDQPQMARMFDVNEKWPYPLQAERVRAAPVPRVVPGRPGRRRVRVTSRVCRRSSGAPTTPMPKEHSAAASSSLRRCSPAYPTTSARRCSAARSERCSASAHPCGRQLRSCASLSKRYQRLGPQTLAPSGPTSYVLEGPA